MAEIEKKTISDIVDDRDWGRGDGLGEINKNWIFGWDIESITGYTKQELFNGHYLNKGKHVNLNFVRDLSIPIVAELEKLEKEYKKEFYCNSNYINKPDKPIEAKFGISSVFKALLIGVLSFFIVGLGGYLIFSIMGLMKVTFFQYIFFIIVFITPIIVIISSIKTDLNSVKEYKKNNIDYMKKLEMYNEAYSIFNRNRNELLEKAKSLSEDSELRQSALKNSINAWERRPQ